MNDCFTVTPLLPVAVCLIVGIVVGSLWQPCFPLVFVLAAAVAAAFACHSWPSVQTVAILACCMVLGMALVQVQDSGVEDVSGRELHGVVMSEPAERPKTIGVDILVPSASGRTLRCYLWKDDRSRALELGDQLVVRMGKGHLCRDWHPGGDGARQLSQWQRTRLWFLKQRHKILRRYRDFGAEEETYAVLAAMTLGDRSAQTADLREMYSVSGASHVLAISGMHVGIVYMLVTWLMFRRRQFLLSQVVTVAAIWAFALLTGLSPSVMRAVTMISIYAVFASRGTRSSPVNGLCFAAIVMLVADVQSLFDVGFQMSFAAVLAILLFMPMLRDMYQPRNTVMRWIWSLCLLSFSAQLGVAPLIAYYFGRFSTCFLLTNFFVIPAAFIILYGSLLSLLIPPVSVALLCVVRVMNSGLRMIANMSGAGIDGLHPTVLQVVLAYVLVSIFGLLLRFYQHSFCCFRK